MSEKRELKICNGPVSTVTFNQMGTMLAAGDATSQIALMKIKPGMEVVSLLQGHKDIVNSCVFSSEEAKRMVSVSQDKTMRIWDVTM